MLIADVERYVALQRSLGLRFDEQARLLLCYARFASAAGDGFVVTQRVRAWSSEATSPRQARLRYDTARRFAAFLRAEDGRHEVPPSGAFGRGRRPRPAPYLLSPSEIAAIMTAALDVPPKGTISPLTYHHLFGLLAATGLRISEALALKRTDLTDDGLVVRRGKFAKSRLLPLHPSTRAALDRYLVARQRLGAGGDDLFVVRHGRAPTKVRVYCVFVRLARALGIRGVQGARGPRLHDLRHSFAVRSLTACPPDRTAVTRHMLALSTYMGHADVAATYWYLQATPVLLNGIAAAAEQAFAGGAA
ncbi:tyrosine-type recombinase/integrase [Methylobacterium isbiliense]|uniref:Tyrosine recombinase XerC n=1 Tax=Methylobacterium isbiliense TaxID=315478 RepID=A0ABQ4SIG5_9HYPH|nr:tyrosine-type recombinase/integrase [Methylobacterium isbiliense]MDN3626166.1 tyrosine-type recombinase/integrase [Methylobacterium isbiliense]GJE02984.1 Tyrosine recombinase XerC [Methylobacterium isbiliense]